MFSVYGASGRLFRGTLEQLRQVAPVHSVDRTRAIVLSCRQCQPGGQKAGAAGNSRSAFTPVAGATPAAVASPTDTPLDASFELGACVLDHLAPALYFLHHVLTQRVRCGQRHLDTRTPAKLLSTTPATRSVAAPLLPR